MSYKRRPLLILLLISTFFISDELIIRLFDKSDIYSPYYQIDGIVCINIITIVINIILISLIIINHTNKKFQKDYVNYLIFFLTLISISLIWLEIYYGSTFYYGEIRYEQSVWYLVNNFGAVGSIILSFSLFDFKFSCKRYNNLFDISYITLLIVIHIIILCSLNEKWRIFFPSI